MPKIGVVGTIGGWSSEMLADKVAEKTGYRLLIDPKKICLDLGAKTVRYKDTDLADLDGLMIKKVGARYSPDLLDRLEMLRFLHERGLRMFSNPFAIMRVLDRLSCTVTLSGGGIPMPPTTITEDVDAALNAVADYRKAVLKPLFSSKARGMKVISDGPNARREVAAFKQENEIMYIQKMMDLGGQDLGLAFLGGEYLTTYARRGRNASWNTTTRSGGKYQPYTPSDETVALAHRAQALFGLDFTCVDVAETPDGPVVFEVSAFGGFRGIQTASGLDAAELYLEYVLKRI